jgi:hypothetical protein
MVNNMDNNFRKMTKFGLLAAGLYTLFFFAAFSSVVLNKNSDGQIAVAFISAPTSAWILGAIRPLLGMIGDIGSASRNIADWVVLYLAGTIQYFLLGFLITLFLISDDSKS